MANTGENATLLLEQNQRCRPQHRLPSKTDLAPANVDDNNHHVFFTETLPNTLLQLRLWNERQSTAGKIYNHYVCNNITAWKKQLACLEIRQIEEMTLATVPLLRKFIRQYAAHWESIQFQIHTPFGCSDLHWYVLPQIDARFELLHTLELNFHKDQYRVVKWDALCALPNLRKLSLTLIIGQVERFYAFLLKRAAPQPQQLHTNSDGQGTVDSARIHALAARLMTTRSCSLSLYDDVDAADCDWSFGRAIGGRSSISCSSITSGSDPQNAASQSAVIFAKVEKVVLPYADTDVVAELVQLMFPSCRHLKLDGAPQHYDPLFTCSYLTDLGRFLCSLDPIPVVNGSTYNIGAGNFLCPHLRKLHVLLLPDARNHCSASPSDSMAQINYGFFKLVRRRFPALSSVKVSIVIDSKTIKHMDTPNDKSADTKHAPRRQPHWLAWLAAAITTWHIPVKSVEFCFDQYCPTADANVFLDNASSDIQALLPVNLLT